MVEISKDTNAKEKLPGTTEVEVIDATDNGRLKRMPTYINIEATY